MSDLLTRAEFDDISAHLRAACTPNSPDQMLKSWSMPIIGSVWVLNPVQGEPQELYRHEIVQYVGMLKAAGIGPKPARPIRWPGDNA